ncbi:hypothetical protein [Agarivorans sp. JK6]|uniref:hypothetical protein n=1 Tax=Agarivorans sp. JK6 TaxID=2997426 RepID=UPI0038732CA3
MFKQGNFPINKQLCVKGDLVPRKEESLASRIKEHQKFRKQSEARVTSGKKLLMVILVLSCLLTWYAYEFWKLGLGLAVISSGSTLIEYWSYKKHDRALSELSKHQDT